MIDVMLLPLTMENGNRTSALPSSQVVSDSKTTLLRFNPLHDTLGSSINSRHFGVRTLEPLSQQTPWSCSTVWILARRLVGWLLLLETVTTLSAGPLLLQGVCLVISICGTRLHVTAICASIFGWTVQQWVVRSRIVDAAASERLEGSVLLLAGSVKWMVARHSSSKDSLSLECGVVWWQYLSSWMSGSCCIGAFTMGHISTIGWYVIRWSLVAGLCIESMNESCIETSNGSTWWFIIIVSTDDIGTMRSTANVGSRLLYLINDVFTICSTDTLFVWPVVVIWLAETALSRRSSCRMRGSVSKLELSSVTRGGDNVVVEWLFICTGIDSMWFCSMDHQCKSVRDVTHRSKSGGRDNVSILTSLPLSSSSLSSLSDVDTSSILRFSMLR